MLAAYDPNPLPRSMETAAFSDFTRPFLLSQSA
jgi:hypothetical protein